MIDSVVFTLYNICLLMDAFVTSATPQKRQVQLDANKQINGRKKARKYDSSYLNFGFTVAEKEGA